VPVAGPVRIFLVAGGYAGLTGEILAVLLAPVPWDWTAVLARGAVWGAGTTLLACWLQLRAPEVLAVLRGSGGVALLAALSFLTAVGALAVAREDPRPAGPGLAAFVLVAAGVIWGRAARSAAGRSETGRQADRPGS
jgi:hypothetical protein